MNVFEVLQKKAHVECDASNCITTLEGWMYVRTWETHHM